MLYMSEICERPNPQGPAATRKHNFFSLVSFVQVRELIHKVQLPSRVPSDLKREEPCARVVLDSHYSQDSTLPSGISQFPLHP